ncbi:MAG: AAA family ATPase, partial [bacterium]|nr:AAA family ATPase [bacterium]
MSVTAWLKENHPKIEKIEVNLAAMALDGCSESHLGYRLAALVEGASLRHIRQGLDETTKMAKSAVPGNGTVEEVLDSLSELTLSGRSTKGMERSMGIGEAVQLGFDELQEAQDHQDAPGFRTGVPALDEIWGGMRRGEVVIVAGATGLGKSLFAANLVLSAAGTEWEWLGWRRANTMLVCTEMRLPDVAKR